MSKTSSIQNHRTLYVLIAVFVLPIVLAYWSFYFQDHEKLKTIETGNLLDPPIPLQAFPLFPTDTEGKWQLIYVEGAQYRFLEDNPTEKLALLKQIHLAIGKESYRVNYRVAPSNHIPFLTEGDIGIVDPNGWLIMYYTPDADPKSIVKDFKRLLRTGHA